MTASYDGELIAVRAGYLPNSDSLGFRVRRMRFDDELRGRLLKPQAPPARRSIRGSALEYVAASEDSFGANCSTDLTNLSFLRADF